MSSGGRAEPMTPTHDSNQHDSSQHDSNQQASSQIVSARENAVASKVLADAPVWSVRTVVPKFVPAAPRAVPGRGVFVSALNPRPNLPDTPTCPTPRSGVWAGSFIVQ